MAMASTSRFVDGPIGRVCLVAGDSDIRREALVYVSACTGGGERPITWAQLHNFRFGPRRIPLASQQGIFKPEAMRLPVSIRTAPPRLDQPAPYDDEIPVAGRLIYRYRGTDADHYQNQWLRAVKDEALPLIYLLGIAPGIYDVHGAVILHEQPSELAFEVELMPIDAVALGEINVAAVDDLSRRHYLRLVRQRAMQSQFRIRVLAAYREQCSVCRLRRRELLDAAHIISDRAGGLMHVTNGLSLCKIHHAAFDANLLGIRPDHIAEIRSDLLAEIDGPMLRHGLQEVHGQTIHVPGRSSDQPDRPSLERRYAAFRTAF